jgi:hypothetical protein
VAIVGAVQVWRRRSRGPWLVLVLTLPLAGLLAMVAGNSYRLYTSSAALAFMHGRYLMPAITGVAVLFAAGAHRLLGARPRVIFGIVLASAAIIHRMALLKLMAHFWGPPGGSLRDTARSAVAYAPWPGEVLAGFAVVTVLGVIACGWALFAPMGDDPEPIEVESS